jgi:hypothetical protein
MDYLMVVTAAGKSYLVLSDSCGRIQIVRRERIATTTGTQSPHPQQKRQHLFLSMAGPHAK